MCRTPTQHPTPTQHNNHSKQLEILQWNTHGLISHWGDFKNTIHTLDPDIICIQETHLRPRDPYTLRIHPYTLYRTDHQTTSNIRQGGVAFFVKHNISHKLINLNTQYDIQAVEIHTNDQVFTLVNCYMSPSHTDNTFPELDKILRNINTPILTVGDFNAHHPLWEKANYRDRRGIKLHNIIHNNNMVCLNTGETTLPGRFINHQNTTPDVTFATDTLALRSNWKVNVDTYISDHNQIHITI